MRKTHFLFTLILTLFFSIGNLFGQTQKEISFPIFTNIIFYGGYAKLDTIPNVQNIKEQNAYRIKTSLVTKKLDSSILASLGDSLSLKVRLGSTCDYYDRIGNVYIALIPKSEGVVYPGTNSKIKRIEIARFITPFMDSKIKPNEVPYTYDISNIATILKDSTFNKSFDFWIEFEIFGRYLNLECKPGRSSFWGSLELETSQPRTKNTRPPLMIPITVNEKLFNYNIKGTDTVGATVKTLSFFTSDTIYDAKLYTIISNHGAVNNGEEYYVRNHFIYLDTSLIAKFKPDVGSCEPYRKYNTQANNVYGKKPKKDILWKLYSNWCPGAAVPTRSFSSGTILPGRHSITIAVPDAVFYNREGNFPFSIYIQGNRQKITTNIDTSTTTQDFSKDEVTLIIKGDLVEILTHKEIKLISILNTQNKVIWKGEDKTINTSGFKSGLYHANIYYPDGSHSVKIFEIVKENKKQTR